jgi:hypothetical protein
MSDLQSTKSKHNNDRKLHPILHLDIPQQKAGKDSQRPIYDDRNSRKEEPNAAVKLRIAVAVCRFSPKCCDRMANVRCSKDKDYRGDNSHGDETPEGPDETTARITDSQHGDANAGFDRDGAGGVEELGDEEELRRDTLAIAP